MDSNSTAPCADYILIPLAGDKGFSKISPEDIELALASKWRLGAHGYAVSCKHCKDALLHRRILCTPEGFVTDHINGDKLDNRRSNLRVATPSQNQQNNRGRVADRKSRYKGIVWLAKENKWAAGILIYGRYRRISRHIFQEDAARAYDSAALFYFREFARTNFPDAIPISIEELRHLRKKENRKGMASMYPFVHPAKTKGRWAACVYINGKKRHIAQYSTQEAAARSHDSAALFYNKRPTITNFPDVTPHSIEELRKLKKNVL